MFRSEVLPNNVSFYILKNNSVLLILMSPYLSVNTCLILDLTVVHKSAISYHCNAIMKLYEFF